VAIEAPAAGAEGVTDDTPGSVVGVALFQGQAPQRQPLALSGCDHGGDEPPLDNRIIVTDGRVQNVFVSLKGPRGGTAPPPTEPVVLDQRGCLYTPRVLGLQVGQELRVRNADPLNHNVHVYARRKTFPNNTQAPGADDFVFVFERKEPAPVPIGCDIHPWMKSTVHVTDHPFFAVTDAAGEFRIDELPPGEHTLSAWHEIYGKLTAELDLPPGGTARLEFTFSK
jgi:plastocyanin